MEGAKSRYRSPPLVEAVFAVQWALQNVADAIKYDIGLDQAVYRLRERVKADLPRFERRIPPGFGGSFNFNYEPQFRFFPARGMYPNVQLGAGVCTIEEDGLRYRFEEYVRLVDKRLNDLAYAYENLGDDEADLRPRQLVFLLRNRVELTDWDAFEQNAPVGLPTKASDFIRTQLGFDLTTPLSALTGATLSRQELSRTFKLEGEIGTFRLTVRDATETKDAQIVEWDQEVVGPRRDSKLDVDATVAWLRSAHDYTHRAFGLLCADKLLTAYFERET